LHTHFVCAKQCRSITAIGAIVKSPHWTRQYLEIPEDKLPDGFIKGS